MEVGEITMVSEREERAAASCKRIRRRTTALLALVCLAGCATQRGKVVDVDTPTRVGSHRAGAEIYDPAAESAVYQVLVRF